MQVTPAHEYAQQPMFMQGIVVQAGGMLVPGGRSRKSIVRLRTPVRSMYPAVISRYACSPVSVIAPTLTYPAPEGPVSSAARSDSARNRSRPAVPGLPELG